MGLKNNEGRVGLFYIVDGNIYTMINDPLENEVDSMNEIQPLYNHEYLLDKMKYGDEPNFKELQDYLGYDLRKATVWTFPRGRVWYNVKTNTYTISSSHRLLEDPHYRQIILDTFHLNGQKVYLNYEGEYENFDESYL